MALFTRLVYQAMPPREFLTKFHCTRLYSRSIKKDCVLLSCTSTRHINTQAEDIPRVKETETEKEAQTFECIHDDITRQLDTRRYVKASNVNNLFYKCTTLDQLKQAKNILARFRSSPSHARDSMSTVVILKCMDLEVPHEAIEIAMDRVKYGIFPRKKPCKMLLQYYFDRLDMKGINDTIEIMKMNDIMEEYEGIGCYFKAKVMAGQLFKKEDEVRVEDKDDEERVEDKEGEERVEDKDGEERVEDKDGEERMEDKEGEVRVEDKDGEERVEDKDGEERVDARKQLSFDGIKPVVLMCMKSYEHSPLLYGPMAIHQLHKYVLRSGLTHLSSQMMEFLETRVSEGVMLIFRLDRAKADNDVNGVLSILNIVKEKEIKLTFQRFESLTEYFDANENDEVREQFHALKLKVKVKYNIDTHKTAAASSEKEHA